MNNDPVTGLPLINAQDKRPITVEVITDGNPMNTVIRDAETKRRIDGVCGIKWDLSAERGGSLTLEFGPLCYKLKMLNEKVTDERHPPAQLVDIQTDEPVSLKSGDLIKIMTPQGAPYAVLTATVFDDSQDENDATGGEPDAPETQGIEGSSDDDEPRDPSKPALGKKQ